MTARAKTGPAARPRKRTPARQPRLSAHTGYRRATTSSNGRVAPGRYHAVADQDGQRGTILIYQGDALCGSTGPWSAWPDGLFPPFVNCRWCRQIAASAGIIIREGDQL